MADSPAHRFGQVIGNLLEEILLPVLLKFCEERDLYLDRHGERVGVRAGKKVSWPDKYGNSHDLDFVIEKGGSQKVRGRPVAFIEAAWRRYTKHSRNKAQEIQGAVLPIAEKYEKDSPFLGAVLAGEFTTGSLDQLRSLNFQIVYLPYASVVDAFAGVGVDAKFDEHTPDRKFSACIRKIEALSKKERSSLKAGLLKANAEGFNEFFDRLRRKLDRTAKRILVLPLYGESVEFGSVEDAILFLDEFRQQEAGGQFQKYEVSVVYSNRDELRGSFSTKKDVTDFLEYVAAGP